MNKSKCIKAIVIFEVVAILLCACGTRHKKKLSSEALARKQVEISLQAIKDEDPKPIEKMFCKYVKENVLDLEEKIREMFDFIDGDIVSYGMVSGGISSYSNTEKEGRVEETVDAGIVDIKTSTGKTYALGQGFFTINKKHPDYVGMTNITVWDKDLETKDGYPDGAIYDLYAPGMFGE